MPELELDTLRRIAERQALCREHHLADWLSDFLGGGSNLDVPVREMPRMYAELHAPAGDTDVLFLTDAKCQIPDDVARKFAKWKAESKARLITLVIQSEPGDLIGISDEVHLVPSLLTDHAAVERVLSI